ncbi:MAG: hypothetical protein C0510_00460 [Erythrobacter sp.]|nr:hypothetical protein [Erythrobacter sp.]
MQDRLRKERLHVAVETFASQLKARPDITVALWEMLREQAFVRDFRPEADDDLYKVFAMDPEVVRDELIDVLLAKLELNVSGIDFTGFDFASIKTPRDVSIFVAKIANAQGEVIKGRMCDLV